MLPEAHIRHHIAGRIRFQIPARRRDQAFFESIGRQLKTGLGYRQVHVSALTAGVTIEDEHADLESLVEYAATHGLFTLGTIRQSPVPIARHMGQPVRALNGIFKEVSGGALDLPSALLLLLMGIGLTELAVGNFRRPPWYTAFWYAFGLFSKSFLGDMDGDGDGE